MSIQRAFIVVIGLTGGCADEVPVEACSVTGEIRDCTTVEGCVGSQECGGDSWQACVAHDDDILRCSCTDGAVRACTDDGGSDGGQECAGGEWSDCRVGIAQLTAGDFHTCARYYSGAVKCWGRNDNGELGYGDTLPRGDDEPASEIGYVDLGQPAVDINAGANHTCAVLNSGDVSCWGAGAYGVLGYGNESNIGDDESPWEAGPITFGERITKVEAGAAHSCALTAGGQVYCWGINDERQHGHATTENIGDDELPRSVGPLAIDTDIIDLGAGGTHSCAIVAGQRLRCWGGDRYTEVLGYGVSIPDDEPAFTLGDVDVGGDVASFAGGVLHSCVLLTAGDVRCWGESRLLGLPQVGDTIGDGESPATIDTVDVGGPVIQVEASAFFTCALLASGGVRCWGLSGAALGYQISSFFDFIGDDETPASMGDIQLGGRATQIAVGLYHVCALLDTGAVRCWGKNDYGQLGYGHRRDIGDDEWPMEAGDVPL